MARSFLFPTDDADAQTTRLIASVAGLTGFMKGEPGAPRPGWHVPGADNAELLAQLRAALAATYPEAGAPFWAVRIWTNLTWQPAYLAVLAVHGHGGVPELTGISQRVRGIYLDGYRLTPGPLWSGPVEAMIERAGAQLRDMTDTMLAETNSVARLKPLPARRLLADRILGLMVRVAQRRPEVPLATIRAWSDQWLDVLGLRRQGDLDDVTLPDGRQAVIVHRKGCCLDYLITPERLCSTCPRQEDALRVARQMAEWAEA